MFLTTNNSPGKVWVTRCGTTRESEHPINSVCGFCCCPSSSKNRWCGIFKKGEKILFIGDSITHGRRKGDMNHYLGHGFAAEIAMRYLAYRPELDLQFANRGISGDSSSNVVARWLTDAVPFTPAT